MFDLALPDPVRMIEGIADEKLKRKAIKSTMGVGYSAAITGLFELGRKRLFGFGRVLQQVARSIYLSLKPMEDEGLLALAIPNDVLRDLEDPDEMAKFRTEYLKKL